METNKAIAYNNVVITDPKSTMKAGIVEFDLKTKNININPESIKEEIKVITN
jgi:lipopolysaccharide export system protein LptA